MCDPATLTAVAMTASTLGTAYTGIATAEQHDYQSKVAANNAELSREQARDSEERGLQEQIRQAREIAAVRSAQIAQFAASGIDTSSGSALELVGDTNYFGMLDQQMIRENAGREARGFNLQAQNFQQEAGAQRRARTGALVNTTFRVGADILGGASQLKSMQMPKSGGRSPWGPR